MMNYYDWNMMQSFGLGGGFWMSIMGLGLLIWLLVGVLALIWLWKQIVK
ncbi:MAG: hypothetical protein HYV65_00720 [Candidatus Spechtbacteria bacterium]|nr:hypothetical protein [Candidatus Spechtbacteria bacterium]